MPEWDVRVACCWIGKGRRPRKMEEELWVEASKGGGGICLVSRIKRTEGLLWLRLHS